MTGLLHVSDRLFTDEKSRVLNEVQRTFKEVMVKEVTGLLHISDRLLAGELSRVSSARNSSTIADRMSSDFFACGSGQRNSLALVLLSKYKKAAMTIFDRRKFLPEYRHNRFLAIYFCPGSTKSCKTAPGATIGITRSP